jgi:hypothetical protein
LRVDVQLFVRGVDPLRVGRDPHLDEVDGLVAAGVHLAVPNPRARAHPLGEAGVDDARVAQRVLVLQFSFQHPRDDLHVVVRVRAKARARLHHVLVVHEQQAVVRVARVVVMPEAETVFGVQPVDRRDETVGAAMNVSQRGRHGSPPKIVGSQINCTTTEGAS